MLARQAKRRTKAIIQLNVSALPTLERAEYLPISLKSKVGKLLCLIEIKLAQSSLASLLPDLALSSPCSPRRINTQANTASCPSSGRRKRFRQPGMIRHVRASAAAKGDRAAWINGCQTNT